MVVRDRYDNFRPQLNGGKIVVYAPPVRREVSPAPRPYPSANIATPVVNNGHNAYRPPAVGPYAVRRRCHSKIAPHRPQSINTNRCHRPRA